MLLLVPSDPLAVRRADPHFAEEAEAARELGWVVALVDHDALERGLAGGALPRRLPDAPQSAVYRGWMLRSEQYTSMATALADRGVVLRTDPVQYRGAHELPAWYGVLAPVTPRSVWTRGPDLEDFIRCCRELRSGPAVLRDHVKSLKHSWDEAAYVPDVADEPRAAAVARRFLELRGSDFTGGFVVRRFEEFDGAESRTWWVAGKHVLTTAHPGTPTGFADENSTASWLADEVAPVVRRSGPPFVTVDVVVRSDGTPRVVELGDGQVSDRPGSTPAREFVEKVLGAW